MPAFEDSNRVRGSAFPGGSILYVGLPPSIVDPRGWAMCQTGELSTIWGAPGRLAGPGGQRQAVC
eukprot:7030745-Alexandrium_andersonii.AAC.1